jgi:hypothetical protein
MSWTRRDWIVMSSVAALATPVWAVGEGAFKAPPVEEMKSKVTLDQVTIGVEAYDTEEKVGKIFGKLNPNRYEVLPVLLVIKNGRKGALRTKPLQLEYIVPGQGKVEALRSDEVIYAGDGPVRPNLGPSPFPIPRRKKKNPLSAAEIEGRAFAAPMIAAGESASGFVYFNIKHRANAKFYLSGLRDATSQQDLFYYEIPFEA